MKIPPPVFTDWVRDLDADLDLTCDRDCDCDRDREGVRDRDALISPVFSSVAPSNPR